MPTNLPAEAKVKWAKYLEARTPEEKLRALQEFLSAVPKHKGTENLRAWVRRKISELREEIEERRVRRTGKGVSFFIEKEGAAQIIMLGFPNSGKSSLLRILTNAKPEVSDLPFTTKYPVPGMMPYEDIQFQVIEAPALIKGASKGAIGWGSRVLGLARNADMIMLVIDLSNNPIYQIDTLVSELEYGGILIRRPKGHVIIEKSKAIKGIKVFIYGKLVNSTINDVVKLLNGYRIYNAIVKIFGEASIDDVEKAIFENVVFKPSVIVLNKYDLVNEEVVKNVISYVKKFIGVDQEVVVVSAKDGYGVRKLPEVIFKTSNIIRVYTKEPNSPKPSPKPLILPKGSRVEDAVVKIREEFLKYFKYARIWGPSAKYPGERVGLEHELRDGDIIEIRTKIRGI
ncbi:MAG TPA: TGS domain-containing protein [Acidilobales archaeon]|nr:TGS domain-containing protein [Acidilobales archaeon]